MSDSPFSPSELRAAAETHNEIGPEYRDAVLESFVERLGKEIDARVDARLAQAAARPAPPVHPAAEPKSVNPMGLAVGSIALGIPITGIVVAAGEHPVGLPGVVVVWIAIALINIAYAVRTRPPHDHR